MKKTLVLAIMAAFVLVLTAACGEMRDEKSNPAGNGDINITIEMPDNVTNIVNDFGLDDGDDDGHWVSCKQRYPNNVEAYLACEAGLDTAAASDDESGQFVTMIRMGDCNDNDSNIYPGAPEVFDGKDNNCDGAFAPGECKTDLDCPAGYCDTVIFHCFGCINDTDCDDGLFCNGSEVCTSGACLPGTVLVCNDSDLCTADSCNPATGCVYDAIDTDDADACTTDSCDPVTGMSHVALVCSIPGVCQEEGICNPGTGACEYADTVGCCTADIDCVGSTPADLPAGYLWGCTQEDGTAGVCTSCDDSDGDDFCSMVETCNNGFDDVGNGLVDCADIALCAGQPCSLTGTCSPSGICEETTGDCCRIVQVTIPTSLNLTDPVCLFMYDGFEDGVRVTAVSGICSISLPLAEACEWGIELAVEHSTGWLGETGLLQLQLEVNGVAVQTRVISHPWATNTQVDRTDLSCP